MGVLCPHPMKYCSPGLGLLGVGWIPMDTPPIPQWGLCQGSVMGIVGVGWIQTDTHPPELLHLWHSDQKHLVCICNTAGGLLAVLYIFCKIKWPSLSSMKRSV